MHLRMKFDFGADPTCSLFESLSGLKLSTKLSGSFTVKFIIDLGDKERRQQKFLLRHTAELFDKNTLFSRHSAFIHKS